jgi:hypothetical protein
LKGIRTTLILAGLAILGAIVGAALGYLAGIAFVVLTNVSSIEGESGIMVFYEFMPLGALLGMISPPIMFGIWRRTRR